MMRKIFLICLAILLSIQGLASAKDSGLPEAERVKVAVEVTDGSRHKDLNTAQSFEAFLAEKLLEKNLVNILEAKVPNAPEVVPAEKKSSPENFGEILVFEAVELPRSVETPENFDRTFYEDLGARYVIRCEILALGASKVEDKTLGTIMGVVGTGLSFAGNGNSSRDKTLRRVGDVVGLGDYINIKRVALNTVVNMQFISVETGKVLWQENFTGQAVKHHAPSEGFDNAWQQAYIESVEHSAKLISKRVNKYVDNVLIKGKSDKNFMPKKFSIGGLGGFLDF